MRHKLPSAEGSRLDVDRAVATGLFALTLLLNPSVNMLNSVGHPVDAAIRMQQAGWSYTIWRLLWPLLALQAYQLTCVRLRHWRTTRALGWHAAATFATMSLWMAFESAAQTPAFYGPPIDLRMKVVRSSVACGAATSLLMCLIFLGRGLVVLHEEEELGRISSEMLPQFKLARFTFALLGGWLAALSLPAVASACTSLLALAHVPVATSGGFWSALVVVMPMGAVIVLFTYMGPGSPAFSAGAVWGLLGIVLNTGLHHEAYANFGCCVIAGMTGSTSLLSWVQEALGEISRKKRLQRDTEMAFHWRPHGNDDDDEYE